MNHYPEAVTKIANDYLERVKSHLQSVPAREQNEFLREIQSHVYEAYQDTAGEDEIARILAVLRKLGEPGEVVSDRLPGAMMRAGKRRSIPLYILAGVLIALFGMPLGFGGIGVLMGLLCALSGLVIGYYAVAGTFLLVGAGFALSALARLYAPDLWDRLVLAGFIQMQGPFGDFFNQLSLSAQGFLLLLLACVFTACGVGLLWLGRYLLRGLRFLFAMVFQWARRLAQAIRRGLSRGRQAEVPANEFLFGIGKNNS